MAEDGYSKLEKFEHIKVLTGVKAGVFIMNVVVVAQVVKTVDVVVGSVTVVVSGVVLSVVVGTKVEVIAVVRISVVVIRAVVEDVVDGVVVG